MPKAQVLGILAHVDAGKTTLSEQILFRTGVLRAPGRVDHGDTALDASAVERQRGITVFSDQAWFELDGRRFTLMDTPGHIDFAAETERALWALDLAVLVLDGRCGAQSHTVQLFQLLRARGVPTLLFINKTDLPGYEEDKTLEQLRRRLSSGIVPIRRGQPEEEALALIDDAFCDAYLSSSATREQAWTALARDFSEGRAFPVLTGAALSGEGVDELLSAIARLTQKKATAQVSRKALVYKLRHEANGERVVFLKVLGGVFSPRDVIRFGETEEKIHQLRLYRGEAYTPVEQAQEGDAVGVTGLRLPLCGDWIEEGELKRGQPTFRFTPVLTVRVTPPSGLSPVQLLPCLRLLEEEEPLLGVNWDAAHSAITLQMMGPVQIEIVQRLLAERFGILADFLPPLVLYKETLSSAVVGCGHYEPLRHYAEVHLRLSPAPRGGGIHFSSRCSVDDLPLHYQNLIRTHVFEKIHPGALTGSPIADLNVELLSGRAHLKHTEGGDFREAVFRAIRQGLFKGESVLLEPWYRFALTLPQINVGRAMTDLQAMACNYQPPQILEDEAVLEGRGPVRTLMGYETELRAYTHGKGSLHLEADGYDLCHNAPEVVEELAYNAGGDTENPAGSVFCSHGAGYFVPWEEADEKMHLPVESA